MPAGEPVLLPDAVYLGEAQEYAVGLELRCSALPAPSNAAYVSVETPLATFGVERTAGGVYRLAAEWGGALDSYGLALPAVEIDAELWTRVRLSLRRWREPAATRYRARYEVGGAVAADLTATVADNPYNDNPGWAPATEGARANLGGTGTVQPTVWTHFDATAAASPGWELRSATAARRLDLRDVVLIQNGHVRLFDDCRDGVVEWAANGAVGWDPRQGGWHTVRESRLHGLSLEPLPTLGLRTYSETSVAWTNVHGDGSGREPTADGWVTVSAYHEQQGRRRPARLGVGTTGAEVRRGLAQVRRPVTTWWMRREPTPKEAGLAPGGGYANPETHPEWAAVTLTGAGAYAQRLLDQHPEWRDLNGDPLPDIGPQGDRAPGDFGAEYSYTSTAGLIYDALEDLHDHTGAQVTWAGEPPEVVGASYARPWPGPEHGVGRAPAGEALTLQATSNALYSSYYLWGGSLPTWYGRLTNARHAPRLYRSTTADVIGDTDLLKNVRNSVMAADDVTGCLDPASGELVMVGLQDATDATAEAGWTLQLVAQRVNLLRTDTDVHAPVLLAQVAAGSVDTDLIAGALLADVALTAAGTLWVALWVVTLAGAHSLRIYRQPGPSAAAELFAWHTAADIPRPAGNVGVLLHDAVSGEVSFVRTAQEAAETRLWVYELETWREAGDTQGPLTPHELDVDQVEGPVPPYGRRFEAAGQTPAADAHRQWWLHGGYVAPCGRWQLRWLVGQYYDPTPTVPAAWLAAGANPANVHADAWPQFDGTGLYGHHIPEVEHQWHWVDRVPDRHPLCGEPASRPAVWSDHDLRELVT